MLLLGGELRLLCRLSKTVPNSSRELHKLLSAGRNALTFGLVEGFGVKPTTPAHVDALIKAALDQMIIHPQRVAHLVLLEMPEELRALALWYFIERIHSRCKICARTYPILARLCRVSQNPVVSRNINFRDAAEGPVN